MAELVALEEAQNLVLSHIRPLETETVPILDSVGRIAAADLISDIDVMPFAHAAMDGFALRAAQIADASAESPVALKVIAEVAAGDAFTATFGDDECVRIMTGAPLPPDADAVIQYEIVSVVSGDGLPGSTVAFTAPTKLRNNVREAGEEAHEGEVIVRSGELIGTAGVGFLASCGVREVPVYRRPRVAIIAIGSELVPADERPPFGKIRNSNSYTLAACTQAAGGIPTILPIVSDSLEDLTAEIKRAVESYDFVVTSGGASNGDFDFIKPAVEQLGDLLLTSVNMRPGKAQTFGLVSGVPVFGLPGNPAAAFCGFELIIRPALRKMQGMTALHRSTIRARLTDAVRKKDPRRIYLRSTFSKTSDGAYVVTPAKNQSSGSFGVIQRSNCLAILPEGSGSCEAGDEVSCILLDVPEEVVL